MSFDLPSIRSIFRFTGGLFAQVPLATTPSAYTPYGDTPTCPIDSPVSCHNSTAAPNSCCFIYPGGQLLSTQFWDTSPSIGPVDRWTLHGLWPDLCDGTYPSFCTEAPQYHNITSVLQAANQTELLADMLTYWLPNRGTPESFWQHEWNKHGTCVNTLAPSCYTSYNPGDELIDFLARSVAVYKTLDTYAALAAAGITPSRTARYTEEAIQTALTKVTGNKVYLGCWRGRLNEVWYSFNVKGSLQGGEFVGTVPAGKGGRGTCPRRGIRYLPKA